MTEDVEELEEWTEQNFKAMKTKIQNLEEEMRNNKPKMNINVRRVDSDNLEDEDTDQIIVEHKVERWYSINYFKKMMQIDSSDNKNSENKPEAGDTIDF